MLHGLLRPPVQEAFERKFSAGSYLTDGRRLFRVVSRTAATTGDVLIALEDCRTLRVRSFVPRELEVMGLRSV